jgi:hypothetical protein
LHITRDAGATWTDLSANLPGLPFWGTISNIEASRFDEGTAYISVDAHQVNNRDPFIYRTADYGRTWRLLVNGIAKSPLSYVHVVREDPVRRGLLYAGTENGVYVSFNDGERWQPLQNNLPHAPAYWLTVQEHFNDLVVATYGRGFWILDDITPLRSMSAEVAARPLNLFAPRSAYRFMNAEAPFADTDDPVNGTNPQYGASLNFLLRDTPKDSVVMTVTDAAGKVVRTERIKASAGMNRYWWDLRTDKTKIALLRAANPYSPEVRYPAEGKAAPGLTRFNALVPPGTYTVALAAAGTTQQQSLSVLRDPSSGAPDEEIRTQTAMAGEIATDINAAVDMINALEIARAQVATVRATLGTDANLADVRAQSDSMEKKLLAVEEQLLQVRTTGRGQDQIRMPFRFTEQMVYLGQSITGSDYAPTAAHKEVQGILREQLAKIKVQFDATLNTELNAFRQLLRSRNIQNGIMF